MTSLHKVIFQVGKPLLYRTMRIWVHVCLIAISGFVNLFYGGIVPIIQSSIKVLNEGGFYSFFQNARLEEILAVIFLGIPHFCIAIFSLIVSLASIDALKDRLLNSVPREWGNKAAKQDRS